MSIIKRMEKITVLNVSHFFSNLPKYLHPPFFTSNNTVALGGQVGSLLGLIFVFIFHRPPSVEHRLCLFFISCHLCAFCFFFSLCLVFGWSRTMPNSDFKFLHKYGNVQKPIFRLGGHKHLNFYHQLQERERMTTSFLPLKVPLSPPICVPK